MAESEFYRKLKSRIDPETHVSLESGVLLSHATSLSEDPFEVFRHAVGLWQDPQARDSHGLHTVKSAEELIGHLQKAIGVINDQRVILAQRGLGHLEAQADAQGMADPALVYLDLIKKIRERNKAGEFK